MARRRCEFVDSRLRRSPPDRAGAVPYGQAGENAMRFPHLDHRSEAAHKLHSTTAATGMNLIPGKLNHQPATSLSLFFPEAVQTTGTVANIIFALRALETFERSLNALGLDGLNFENAPAARPLRIEGVSVSVQPTAHISL
jgi:hypothetical protein